MGFGRNMGLADRVIRTGLSIALIYVGFVDQTWLSDPIARYLLGGAGCLMLVPTILAYCPIYHMIGIDTSTGEGSQDKLA